VEAGAVELVTQLVTHEEVAVRERATKVFFYLTQCINQIVLESHPARKIASLLF
jgi:hypothetical protein